MTNEKPEVLQRITEFEAKLAALGISADKIPEVSALLSERSDLQADLEHYRDNQFYDDALALLHNLSFYRRDKTDHVAVWLREFAEYIAKCASGVGDDGVKSLVDTIVPMRKAQDQ